jgi:uncharacterized Fe-S radical SAM superfamily protein PflX
MQYLLNMHDEAMHRRISQTIQQLHLLDVQLKIAKELLLNCTKGPTKKLVELKECIKTLIRIAIKKEVKGVILAEKAS